MARTPNWVSTISSPNIRSGSVDVGRQPNLSFDSDQFVVTEDNITDQNSVAIRTSTLVTQLTGSFADRAASYLVIGLTGSLPNERRLTAGTNITFVDTGAGGELSISAATGSASPVTWGNDLVDSTSSAQRVAAITGPGPSGSVKVYANSLAFQPTPSTTGLIRIPNNSVALAARDSGNTGDLTMVAGSSSELFVGGDTSYATQWPTLRQYVGTQAYHGIGSTTYFGLVASTILFGVPTVYFSQAVASPTFRQDDASAGAGQNMTVQAQKGAASNNGGNLILSGGLAGAGAGNAGGNVILATATGSLAFTNQECGASGASPTRYVSVMYTSGSTTTRYAMPLYAWQAL